MVRGVDRKQLRSGLAGRWLQGERNDHLLEAGVSLRQIQQHMFVYWGLLAVVLLRSVRWTRRSEAWMGALYLAYVRDPDGHKLCALYRPQ